MPSQADIAATRELKDLAQRLGVVFLDHLVLGAKGGGLCFTCGVYGLSISA